MEQQTRYEQAADPSTWRSTSPRESRRQSFDTWMAKVNVSIYSRCGLVSDDLPDYGYADAYEMGETPSNTARQVIQAAQD